MKEISGYIDYPILHIFVVGISDSVLQRILNKQFCVTSQTD
jgi:hypothetical protein